MSNVAIGSSPALSLVPGSVRILPGLVLAVALLVPGRVLIAAGPAPVNLGSAAHFTVLAGAAVTTTGGGDINGAFVTP